jgi:hypothetical protein
MRRVVLYGTRLQDSAAAEDLPRVLAANRRWVYLNLSLAGLVLVCTAAARALA